MVTMSRAFSMEQDGSSSAPSGAFGAEISRTIRDPIDREALRLAPRRRGAPNQLRPHDGTPPTTATAEDRRQAERCHARALEEMERGPGVVEDHLARTNTHWVTIFNPVTFAVVAMAAPVWYPVAKTKLNQRLYDEAVARCLEEARSE